MDNVNANQWLSGIMEKFESEGKLTISFGEDASENEIQQRIQEAANDVMQQAECRCITLEDISGLIVQLSNSISQNSALLLENVIQLMKKNEIKNRNKKPRRIGEKLIVSPNDFLGISYQYDNGTAQYHALTRSVSGDFAVFTLDFKGHEDCEKFAILFRTESVFVFGSKKRLRGNYLYECFVKAGIRFNADIPRTIVAESLNEFFAPMIENGQNCFVISPFAGWNGGKFFDNDNFAWRKTTEFPDLPVFHKHFNRVEMTDQMVNAYFRYLQQIVSVHDRALVAVIPFIGCMASIIKEAWCEIPFFINFVIMEEFDWTSLCKVMKIFNREDLRPDSLDITEKNWWKFFKIRMMRSSCWMQHMVRRTRTT